MPNGYHHLTHPERSPIFALKSTGRSQRQIAAQLGRDVSTISRELSRNRGQRGYRHQQAQGKATSRRRAASAVPWKMTPDHSGERGLNEHTNGLVRQYFPKGTDFRQVTLAQVQVVADRINRRPRKVLGYRTPEEVFTAAAPLGQNPPDTARAGPWHREIASVRLPWRRDGCH